MSRHVVICRPAHQLFVRDRKLARSYVAAGCRVSFLGNRRRMQPVACPDVDRHEYVGFGYPYRSWWMPVGTLAYSGALYRRLCHLRPEIILAGDLEGLLGAVLYKRLHAADCILIYDIADNFAARYRLDRFTRAALQYLDDRLMACCDEILLPQEDRFSNFRFRLPKRSRLVPNCPLLAESPAPRAWDVTPPVRILLSGLMTWSRGIRQIVEAAGKSGVAQVVAVPGDATVSREIVRYLSASGVVEYHPPMPQAELLKLAQTCHLVAAFYEPSCPLHYQAAPNKVFDAMAASRPSLINQEVGMSRTIVETWRCGFTVPYFDVEALARLLTRISRDPTESILLGKNGRRLFEAEYHWERSTQGIETWGKGNGVVTANFTSEGRSAA